MSLASIIGAVGQQGGEFSPDDIAGLTLWYDADAITGLIDGDPVTTWEDLSASAADASQATAASQPIYKTGIQNGLPIVRFDGSNDEMFTGSTVQAVGSGDGTWTAFAVAINDTLTTSVDGIISQDANSGNRVAQFLRTDGTTPQAIAFNTGVSAFTDTAAAISTATAYVHEALRTTTSVERFVDGVGDGATATTGTPESGAQVARIGRSFNNTSEFWDGDIAEILVYDSDLSSADRTSVREYLADKWGVTL